MQFEFLNTIVALLDDAEIPHMLAGSMASTFHGEPRMTRDIDMVIDPTIESMTRFVSALDGERYYVDDAVEAVRRRDMCNVVAVLSAQDLDRAYLLRWAAELGVADSLDEALTAATNS